MKTIQCISYPRSGHHLLVRCLVQIYDDRFRYCDFYNHCSTFPCEDPKTNFQKNHDLKLDLTASPEHRYLIQYRHPIESISSWFDFALKNPNIWERLTIRENERSWNSFFQSKLAYWKGFVEKWAAGPETENRLLVPYHQLVDAPEETLTTVTKFLWPEEEVADHKIPWVLKIQNIRRKRTAFDFRYASKSWIAETEQELENYLTKYSIPRITDGG